MSKGLIFNVRVKPLLTRGLLHRTLPTVIRRMTFLYGYERAATCVADLSIGDELRFDGRTVFGRIDDSRPQRYLGITRRRTEQFDVKISRNGAIEFAFSALFDS